MSDVIDSLQVAFLAATRVFACLPGRAADDLDDKHLRYCLFDSSFAGCLIRWSWFNNSGPSSTSSSREFHSGVVRLVLNADEGHGGKAKLTSATFLEFGFWSLNNKERAIYSTSSQWSVIVQPQEILFVPLHRPPIIPNSFPSTNVQLRASSFDLLRFRTVPDIP
jgi:hypothetical protein